MDDEIPLWRLQDDGRCRDGSPAELVAMWSAFRVTAERGVYFATYRGMSVRPEAAIESIAVPLAAKPGRAPAPVRSNPPRSTAVWAVSHGDHDHHVGVSAISDTARFRLYYGKAGDTSVSFAATRSDLLQFLNFSQT